MVLAGGVTRTAALRSAPLGSPGWSDVSCVLVEVGHCFFGILWK